ncbi:glycosyltransferase family 4 protein [Halorussus salilacus]|uniref:glycosyltransferase family 4 protein n=1 Tax=Halorussus salilacus TaxID=2953750 RepID=UPI0020A21095|nr:glycosyltransferase family 4 protein [Halorussus salilacus]USZ67393.1 glycosyltransferase family 4 protein [Halorussus salilacus]
MADSEDGASLLVVTQYFPPETGAPASRFDELTKRWSESGNDVTVLTSAPDYPEGELYDGYQNEWLHRERRDGVDVVMTKTFPASNVGFFRRALKFMWFMIISVLVGVRLEKPDVVVATSPQPLVGVSGWLVARVRRAKFVFEVRDLWPESISAAGDVDNRLLYASLEAISSFLYRHADRVVVVSQEFERSIVAAGASSEDILYHPNGVDVSFFEDASEPEFANRSLSDYFVVSYIGTIGRAHGLSVVLDSAAELPSESKYDDVLFLFVGFGAQAETLQRRASEQGLDNVVFAGRRPKEEVPEFLSVSDVSLVHLKDRDLFRTVIPSKMFESMAAGVPIVLGVKGEAKRILTEANAGVTMEPEDPQDLTSAVRHLYDESGRRTEFGSNGADFVRENFDWDAIATEYEQDLLVLASSRTEASEPNVGEPNNTA